MDENRKKAFSHVLGEMEVPNIIDSLQRSDFEEHRKTHNSIHEFMLLAPLISPITKERWQSKSAFLVYHWEAFHYAHRSLLEVLAGYYNSGYILLRSYLEALIKGALWECLAHKGFRRNAGIIENDTKTTKKIYGPKKTLIDWLEEIIKKRPQVERDLEETSAGIFDKIQPILEDPDPIFRELTPTVKGTVKQLSKWGILEPIPNPVNEIYESIYRRLCASVHVIPDETDVGRRILSQDKDIFKVDVDPDELAKYLELLKKVLDIGIVIELNILQDWIDKEAKMVLKKRLPTLKDLNLKYSEEMIEKLTEAD